MDKELEQKMKEVHDMLICQYCWDEGCLALFGNENMTLDMVDAKIRMTGAEKLVAKSTWSFNCPTDDGYEAWLKRKVKLEELPKYVSFDTFAEKFKHTLTVMYQKEKKENDKKANS